jgi:hypothetical protein
MGGIISQVKMREKKNLKTSSMKTILEEKSEFFQVLVDYTLNYPKMGEL